MMKDQIILPNESKISRTYLLVLLILMLLVNSSCVAQQKSNETLRVSDSWEITFGYSLFTTYQMNSESLQIDSIGKAVFHQESTSDFAPENKEKDKAPIAAKISDESLAELDSLVKKLDLSKARAIPDDKYDLCIEPHSADTYFELKIAGQDYTLRHCSSNTQEYEYTLILSSEQKEIYRQLREISLKQKEILQKTTK